MKKSSAADNIDICLVSPPQRAYNHFRPPMAMLYLAAYLSKQGINVAIVDPKSCVPVSDNEKERVVEDIIAELKSKKPKFVGIGCYTNEYADVLNIARRIKDIDSGSKIIVGGVHPTLRPQDFFFDGSPVDYLVIGEGETTLCELVNALKSNNPVYAIQGIAYFDSRRNNTVVNQYRPLIQDLNKLPFPSYDKIDMRYYTRPNPYAIRGIFLSSFYILITRGCPSRCTFCVNKNLRNYAGSDNYFRFRSADNVLDELEYLKKTYRIDGVYIIDDAFTLKRELVEDISKGMIKRKLHLLWGCSTKINAVTKESLILMKKSGCMQIDFGVESGSEEVLFRMKKGITINQIKKAFQLCHEVGIRTFANILVNFPEEKEKDIVRTLELLDEIKPEVTSFNIFIPFLGTDIYDDYSLRLKPEEYRLLGLPPIKLVEDKRFLFAKHNIDFGRFYVTNHKKYNKIHQFISGHMKPAYLKTFLRSGRKLDYLREMYNLYSELFFQLSVK